VPVVPEFLRLEPVIKKVSDVFIVWKPRDRDEIGRKRVGLEKGVLGEIFKELTCDGRDSITIDLTRNSPARLRLNVIHPIEIDSD